jgi:hypothetical protein
VFKENTYFFHKQEEKAITYLFANRTHTASIQGKIRTYPPTYQQKIHRPIYFHKQCVDIPDQEEPQRKTSVEETYVHASTAPRQNTRNPIYLLLILILMV